MPIDLFGIGKRKQLPLDSYWELCDQLGTHTLKHLESFDSSTLNQRILELEKAEQEHGFVYEAELLWLQSISQNSDTSEYAQWLWGQLNESYFNRPARVEIYRNDVYIWKAEFIESKPTTFPFELIPEITELGVVDPYGIRIIGDRTQPSPRHLIQAFERLHNLPYYTLENRDYLYNENDDSGYYFSQIHVIDPIDETQWEVWQNNDYSAPNTWPMVGRSANPQTYFDYFGTLAKELKSTGLAAEHHIDLSNNSLIFTPQGFLWEHRDAFSEELQERIFRHSILADGQIETGCLLQDRKVTCEDGHEYNGDLFFRWGSITELPKYRVGDEIRWDGPVYGIPGLDRVFVKGTSRCPTCHQEAGTLIPVIHNRIQAEDNEFHQSVKFPFQAPFVSDQRIIWEQFQLQWHLLWVTRLDRELGQDDIAALQRKLSDASETEYSDVCVINRWTLWLLSKYRQHLTSHEFETACRLLEFRPVESKPCSISMDARFHSPAVIKVKQRDQWRWGLFHWGSMVNFPEYEIGDSVLWGDCSFGSSTVKSVMCNGSWLDSRERFELRIEDNRIVDCNSIRQDSLRYNAPAAYEPTTPEASWFLDDFEF